jgi:ATP-dependent DNA helicase PIF1
MSLGGGVWGETQVTAPIGQPPTSGMSPTIPSDASPQTDQFPKMGDDHTSLPFGCELQFESNHANPPPAPQLAEAPPVESPPSIPLSEEQSRIVDLAKAGFSVFFTGPAGTGKSLILAHLRHHLKAQNRRFAITAPTGISAVQIGGRTIHSFAGVGKGDKGLDQLLKDTNNSGKWAKKKRATWRDLDVLIIDEVSMLHPDLFCKLDALARAARQNSRAFGGIQVIVCGDFYQLQPVDKDAERPCFKCGQWLPPPIERVYLTQENRQKHIEVLERQELLGVLPDRWSRCRHCQWLWNDTVKFSFQTPSWEACEFKNVLLKKVFRQSDQDWVDILAQIKEGNTPPEVISALMEMQRQLPDIDGIKPTKLYSHRADVRDENDGEFRKLKSQARRYLALDEGVIVDRKTGQTVERISSGLIKEYPHNRTPVSDYPLPPFRLYT